MGLRVSTVDRYRDGKRYSDRLEFNTSSVGSVTAKESYGYFCYVLLDRQMSLLITKISYVHEPL